MFILTLLFAETLKVHNDKIREVFARLRIHNLKLQPDKCEFLRKEVTYLGHKLTTQGLLPDSEKVAAVKKFPTPTNTRQLNIWVYPGIIVGSFRILAIFLNH